MNRTSIIALAAATIFAGIGLGPSAALAGDWLRADIRADKRDIRADRLELRRDRADLREDYRELYRDLGFGRFGDASRDLISAAIEETSGTTAAICSGTGMGSEQ